MSIVQKILTCFEHNNIILYRIYFDLILAIFSIITYIVLLGVKLFLFLMHSKLINFVFSIIIQVTLNLLV